MAAEQEAYVVLARKYRPQGFEEVVGQPAVSITIKNALASKKIHHAYLFTGPRGVGKTTMARILAKALNCVKGPTPEPCGACDPCREITGSSCLDVLEMDAASHTGVDNVRELIIETVALAPARDRYKVFIIDEAHMLSSGAFNALLKTVEEPPPHVVFILATTELTKVPATIASRCQRFRFRPVSIEALAAHLGVLAKKEKIDVEPAALELLARSADGSLRDAVSLLDQCHSASSGRVTAGHVRDMFGLVSQELLLGVAQSVVGRDAQGLARWLTKLYEDGIEPAQLLRDLRAAFENVYLSRLGVEIELDAAWKDLAGKLEPAAASFLLRRLNRALEELKFGDSPRLALELGLFGCLEAAFDLDAWVKKLEDLERRLSSGSLPSASAPQAVPARANDPRLQGQPAAPKHESGSTQAAVRADAMTAPQQTAAAPTGTGAVSAGGAADSRSVWRAALALVAREKPALAIALEKARLDSTGASWTLTFARAFDMEGAKRAQPLIEASLAAAAGRRIGLIFAAGGAGTAASEGDIVDPHITSGAGGAPEGAQWKDVTEGAKPAVPGNSPLTNAQKLLGGKMKIVKKPGA